MKNFNQLTNEELLALTKEDIDLYVDKALAEEGLPLGLDLMEEPEYIKQFPDVNKILLTNYDSILVSEETADQIQKIINNETIYKKEYGGNVRVCNKNDYGYPTLVKHSYESDKKKMELEAERKLLQMEWEKYNTIEENNEEYIRCKEEKLEEIFNQISSVREERNKKEVKLAYWNRYLELAGNDRIIAKNFFVERYSETEYNELFGQE